MTRKDIVNILIIIVLIISIGLMVAKKEKDDFLNLSYEYINTKDMAITDISTKKDNTNIIDILFKGVDNKGVLVEKELPVYQKSQVLNTQRRVWYLPTEVGTISQYPVYNHVAYDIYSPRGVNETIFPIANGVVSGMYRDAAGANIVTIAHNVNGINYTSQYVHLAAYASGLYVGKEVTINDAIGQMGSTGMATGVHLHIAVVDCKLFDSNDPNCRDLNGFFNYANRRLNEGFNGLGSVMNLSGSCNNR